MHKPHSVGTLHTCRHITIVEQLSCMKNHSTTPHA